LQELKNHLTYASWKKSCVRSRDITVPIFCANESSITRRIRNGTDNGKMSKNEE